jgi:hypothetical protein
MDAGFARNSPSYAGYPTYTEKTMSESYCTYCGRAQGDRISCCQENHWLTLEEYREYHNEDPSGYDDINPLIDDRTYEQWTSDNVAWAKRRRRMSGE